MVEIPPSMLLAVLLLCFSLQSVTCKAISNSSLGPSYNEDATPSIGAYLNIPAVCPDKDSDGLKNGIVVGCICIAVTTVINWLVFLFKHKLITLFARASGFCCRDGGSIKVTEENITRQSIKVSWPRKWFAHEYQVKISPEPTSQGPRKTTEPTYIFPGLKKREQYTITVIPVISEVAVPTFSGTATCTTLDFDIEPQYQSIKISFPENSEGHKVMHGTTDVRAEDDNTFVIRDGVTPGSMCDFTVDGELVKGEKTKEMKKIKVIKEKSKWTTINVKWEEVEDIDEYKVMIYEHDSLQKDENNIAMLLTQANCEFTKLNPRTSYDIKIIAIVDGVPFKESEALVTIETKAMPTVTYWPEQPTTHSITLDWNHIDGIELYLLEVHNSRNGSQVKKTTVTPVAETTMSYKIMDLEASTVYNISLQCVSGNHAGPKAEIQRTTYGVPGDIWDDIVRQMFYSDLSNQLPPANTITFCNLDNLKSLSAEQIALRKTETQTKKFLTKMFQDKRKSLIAKLQGKGVISGTFAKELSGEYQKDMNGKRYVQELYKKLCEDQFTIERLVEYQAKYCQAYADKFRDIVKKIQNLLDNPKEICLHSFQTTLTMEGKGISPDKIPKSQVAETLQGSCEVTELQAGSIKMDLQFEDGFGLLSFLYDYKSGSLHQRFTTWFRKNDIYWENITLNLPSDQRMKINEYIESLNVDLEMSKWLETGKLQRQASSRHDDREDHQDANDNHDAEGHHDQVDQHGTDDQNGQNHTGGKEDHNDLGEDKASGNQRDTGEDKGSGNRHDEGDQRGTRHHLEKAEDVVHAEVDPFLDGISENQTDCDNTSGVKYSTWQKRMASFNFSRVAIDKRKSLAQSGLYYDDQNENIRCHFCQCRGIGETETTIQEHLKQDPHGLLHKEEEMKRIFKELLRTYPKLSTSSHAKIQPFGCEAIPTWSSHDFHQPEQVVAAGAFSANVDKEEIPSSHNENHETSTGQSNDVTNKIIGSTPEDLPPSNDWCYPVSIEDLAAAGFKYIGPGDKVQCVYCNGILSKWEDGDDPATEHRKHYPGCTWVKNNKPIKDKKRERIDNSQESRHFLKNDEPEPLTSIEICQDEIDDDKDEPEIEDNDEEERLLPKNSL